MVTKGYQKGVYRRVTKGTRAAARRWQDDSTRTTFSVQSSTNMLCGRPQDLCMFFGKLWVEEMGDRRYDLDSNCVLG